MFVADSRASTKTEHVTYNVEHICSMIFYSILFGFSTQLTEFVKKSLNVFCNWFLLVVSDDR